MGDLMESFLWVRSGLISMVHEKEHSSIIINIIIVIITIIIIPVFIQLCARHHGPHTSLKLFGHLWFVLLGD